MLVYLAILAWIGLVLPQAGFEPSDESMQFFELV